MPLGLRVASFNHCAFIQVRLLHVQLLKTIIDAALLITVPGHGRRRSGTKMKGVTHHP
jgi:hypothetical protein